MLTLRVAGAVVVASMLLVLGGDAGRFAARAPTASVVLVNRSTPAGQEAWGQFCGGIVMRESVVATAAHCVRGRSADLIDVAASTAQLCNSTGVRRFAVREVVLAADESLDLAFLVVGSVGLEPGVDDAAGLGSGSGYSFHGWGAATSRASVGCTARAFALEAVADRRCKEARFPRTPDAAYLCATGTTTSNTCSGDSGSPVFTSPVSSRSRPVAMTLGGAGCATEDLGQYLRIETVEQQLELVLPAYA